jgi:hypothetical protein
MPSIVYAVTSSLLALVTYANEPVGSTATEVGDGPAGKAAIGVSGDSDPSVPIVNADTFCEPTFAT